MNGIPQKSGPAIMDSKSAIKNASFGMTEKNKMWKMEALMEQLRTKTSHSTKTFQELAKSMRMSLLEKRYALDAVEKAHLQKTLDSMQHCIRITTRQGLVERLESLTRQLGLKFTDNNNNLFISSDMFYLEIMLDPTTGNVQDVKVHHECNVKQESCQELVTVLQSGDFNDFTQQLEGFQSIYQLNAESKIKSKAFVALQALEIDLNKLYLMENFQKLSPEKQILHSIVGMLLKRRGGHPMRLFFFVRPHELLNFAQKKLEVMTSEFLIQAAKEKKEFGYSVTINLEQAAPANKLQLEPILNVNQKIENGEPVYYPITSVNGTMLPATFVLRLNKPLPTCVKLIEQIKQITDMNIFGSDGTPLNVAVKQEMSAPNDPLGASKPVSLISLIVQFESENTLQNGEKGLFVSFPDQNHCYFLSDQNEILGLLIKNIQFTEPAHVTKIIKLLKQQALFNALVASCIRNNGKQDLENMYMFEVNAISLNYIQIFVEHPFNESIVTVELDLSDLKELQIKIFYGDKRLTENENQLEKLGQKVLQRGFSIPIMLRSLIKQWEKDYKSHSNIYSYVQSYGDDPKFNLNSSLLSVEKMRKETESGDDDVNNNDKTDGGDDKKEDSKNLGDKEDKKDDKKDDDNFGNGGANGNGNGASGGPDYGSSSGGHHGGGGGSKDTTDSHGGGSGGKKAGSSGDKLLTTDPSGIFDNSSSSFDICGINKNEIFFKTDQLAGEYPGKGHLAASHQQQLKTTLKRVHDSDFDIFEQRKKNVYEDFDDMDYEMDEEEDEEDEEEMMMHDELLNENSSSSTSSESSSSSSNSSTSSESEQSTKKMMAKKSNLIFTSKVANSSSANQVKPLDVFEFTPSPPPGPVGSSLPATSPADPKNSANPNSFLSTLENNRIHDIEIIPLKGQQNQQHGDLLNPATSITITPINSNYYSKGEKRSLGSSVDDKLKKKKKKREDGTEREFHKKPSSQISSSSSSSKKRDDFKKFSTKSPSSGGGSEKMRDSVKKSPAEGKLDSGSPKIKSNNKMKSIEDLTMDPIDPNDPSMFGFTNEEKLMLMSMNAQQGQGMTVPSPLPSPQNLLALKNRKSSLSAVIDKLKSAQTVGDEFGLMEGQLPPVSPLGQSGGSIQLNSSTTITPTGSKDNAGGKNTEYQVKSSTGDGIKITINKTKSSSSLTGSSSPSTSSSSSKSSSGGLTTKSVSSSPKHHHTGLKPGVNSGPLSKKSSQSNSSSSSSQNMSQKLLYQKSSSSGNLGSSKSSSSSSMSQKSMQSKSSSLIKEKSKFSGSQSERSSSPYANLPISIASQAEQFMKAAKTFHIPKLSARNNGGSSGSGQKSSSSGKSDDKVSKDDQKVSQQKSQSQSQQNPGHKFNSAPTTPVQSLAPSPTGDVSKNAVNISDFLSSSSGNGDKGKKLFKSASSEQLYATESKKSKEEPMSKPNPPPTVTNSTINPTQEIINSLARSGVTTTPSPTISPSLAQLNEVLGEFSASQFKVQAPEPKQELKLDERRTPTPTTAMQNPVLQKSPAPLLQSYQQQFNSTEMIQKPAFSPPASQMIQPDVAAALEEAGKNVNQVPSLYSDDDLMDIGIGNKI